MKGGNNMWKKMCFAAIVILAALAIAIPSHAQYENGNGVNGHRPCNFCIGIKLKKQYQDGSVTTSHRGGSPGVTITKTTYHGKQAMFTGTYTFTYTYLYNRGRDRDRATCFRINHQYQEWAGNGMTVRQAQVAWSFAKARGYARSWQSGHRLR